jgi:opacity protein-like surface antigen
MRLKDRIAAAALSLALAATLIPVTGARAALRLAGIDGISSTVLQRDQTSFSGLGLRARVRSDAFVKSLVFMPTMEYWHNQSHLDPYAIRTASSDATLGLDARWEFTTGNTHPYVGAGVALHFLSSEVRSVPLGLDQTDSSMRGGLTLLGGLVFPITSKLGNFIEVKYHDLPRARQVKVNWGLGWNW